MSTDKVNVVSRSLASEEQEVLKQNCKIRIYDGETLIQKYQGVEILFSFLKKPILSFIYHLLI